MCLLSALYLFETCQGRKDPPGDLDRIPEGEEGEEEEEEEEEVGEGDNDVLIEGADRPHSGLSRVSVATLPVITAEQYYQYVKSLTKLMVGEKTTYDWIKKGVDSRGQ